jgi:hypothetical protein
MKAQELRIGNYLKNDVVVKIDAKIIFNIWAEAEDYEPIPITEEWILKFGFEMFDYLVSDVFDDDFVYIAYKLMLKNKKSYYTICNRRTDYFDFCLKVIWAEEIQLSAIKYVHELQNLYFALEGEELEINQHGVQL